MNKLYSPTLISSLIFMFLANTASCFASGYEVINVGGKWGIIRQDTKSYVVDPIYDEIKLADDKAIEERMAGHFSPRFGLVPVRIGNKWGYINEKGLISIDCMFDYADNFRQAPVVRDSKNKIVGGIIYAEVKLNGKIGVIDQRGRYYVDPEFDSKVDITREDLKISRATKAIKYKNNNKSIIFSLSDGRITELPSSTSTKNETNLKPVRLDGKYGFVDKSNKIVIPVGYEKAMDFYDGLAGVRKNDKWGFIDEHGQVVVDYKYDDVNNFSNGCARVKVDNKWGYIDKAGKYLIEPRFNYCWDFLGDRAKVRTEDGSILYIDKTGKYVE